ncbi:hypothetical protein K1719_001711 [Acacia pycnantha]|nr:hypothetical protein K1719_001711 [Acacia pycnantha]
MRTFKDEQIFGLVKAEVYTIELEKRGLPHAHIILWLSDMDQIKTPFDVDNLISAEIPDKDVDPILYELVGSCMVHGPCGRLSSNAPCMKDGKCSKYFPKRKGVHLDNRFVVPYNARLLKLFSAHLNIEKTNQSRAIK